MSRCLAIGLLAVLAAGTRGSAQEQAAERSIGFTTYLREGPGVRYRPLQEALTGTWVTAGLCADGWCQIRLGDAVGYVAQATLRDRVASPAAGPATCFVNREAGYREGRDLSFCYAVVPGSPR